MRSHALRRLRAPAGAALLLLPAACGGHGHAGTSHGPPHYVEAEPNDSFAQADDFGTLFPLEHFVIEGDVDAEGAFVDPFDGFAFRAAAPLFVAFTLHVRDAFADVRVGLYDASIHQVVAYWYQSHGIVYGELDVFDAGAEFHLVVEPLFGDTRYELELESFHLYGAGAARAPAAARAGAAGTAARAAAPLDPGERAAGVRYAGAPTAALAPDAAAPAVLASALVLAVDESGQVISRGTVLFTAGGSWMGMAGDALAE